MNAFSDRVAGSANPETLPHHDTRCGARWSGFNTSHCRGCHKTFTAVGPFDAHQVRGICKDPAELGMVIAEGRAYEAWRLPDREPAPSLPVPSTEEADR